MDKANVNKAQGMYPTPIALIRKCAQLSFSKSDLKRDFYLIEPGAGSGNYIIGVWSHIQNQMDKKDLERIVGNTICFENHRETFHKLKQELHKWLKENEIHSRPRILNENFLLTAKTFIKTDKPVYVVGNPPWDEYTTRKHDDTDVSEIKEIRGERNKEHKQFRALGHKNVYQSFIHVILSIQAKHLVLSFVLPRQILGDKSGSDLRRVMLESGVVRINSFKNKDNPDFEFECVDKNCEIVLLTYKRGTVSSGENLLVCRGLTGHYCPIQPIGDDLTIPCSRSNEEIEINASLLAMHSLGSWSEQLGVEISMGKVKHYEAGYTTALSGKTILPYGFLTGKLHKLVINKILPNSDRKIKAALVPIGKAVNESLVEINCENQDVLYYLYLMMNSKMIDSALRSLVSNINLNIFRLVSLPIPLPTPSILRQSRKLVDKIQGGEFNPNHGSRTISEQVFTNRVGSLKLIEGLYSDHAYGNVGKERAA